MAWPAWSDMPFDASTDAVFVISSTPLSVRQALYEILNHPVLAHLSVAARGSAEVVLAEALNNIVEHAYAKADGHIDLRLQRRPDRVLCDIVDHGALTPGGALPAGLSQPICVDKDLPEGGFGWFLIRSLTENLVYQRIGARNHLSFQFIIEQ